MNKIRRINIYAGPRAGKTVVAGHIFNNLKIKHIECDFTMEFAKRWAWRNQVPVRFDQVKLFSRQMEMEADVLEFNDNAIIVTDSPLLLAGVYAERINMPGSEHLFNLASDFEKIFPSLDIYINRGEWRGSDNGRFHSYEECIEIDSHVKECMNKHLSSFVDFDSKDHDKILQYVLERLN